MSNDLLRDLETARETNRRLNRRLQMLESDLNQVIKDYESQMREASFHTERARRYASK